MTLKELAQNWLIRHGQYSEGNFFARQDCPWCIKFDDDCEKCSLAQYLGMTCNEFLEETCPLSWDGNCHQVNLAWAICEDLANGGE